MHSLGGGYQASQVRAFGLARRWPDCCSPPSTHWIRPEIWNKKCQEGQGTKGGWWSWCDGTVVKRLLTIALATRHGISHTKQKHFRTPPRPPRQPHSILPSSLDGTPRPPLSLCLQDRRSLIHQEASVSSSLPGRAGLLGCPEATAAQNSRREDTRPRLTTVLW